MICLKIRTFVVSATTEYNFRLVPCGCDLLENSYLCGISNNAYTSFYYYLKVVICLKIRTFVVSATTISLIKPCNPWLWFAWKFVPLWYQQQRNVRGPYSEASCDLLENSYLCGISNNNIVGTFTFNLVVICLKIRTFVVSATTKADGASKYTELWFAWKFVPLWYQQQPIITCVLKLFVVICLKIRTFVVSATTDAIAREKRILLWFAWKFVPLWYQQQQYIYKVHHVEVVICLKIRTFVVSATTYLHIVQIRVQLWFAWKFVPLWYQQQHYITPITFAVVVICLKIRTFVVSATTNTLPCLCTFVLWFAWKFVPLWYQQQRTLSRTRTKTGCDLLENSYLCGISNNIVAPLWLFFVVVICLKIRTFVVSATT